MSKTKLTRRAALSLLSGVSGAALVNVVGSNAASSLQDLGSQIETLPEVTVYTAKRVINMEGNEPDIDSVAVVGDRVLAAGPLAKIIERLGQQPFRVDETFSDKVIMAGLIDQHVHPFLAALTLTSEIISIEDWNLPTGLSKAAANSEEYQSRLSAAEAAMNDPDALLFSWGYHHFFHGEVRRAQLDAISRARPIIILHRSAHELILNTAALDLLGITEELVNSFEGLASEQSNFAEGHFYEAGVFAVLPKVAPVLATPQRLGTGLKLTRDYMHRAGVTVAAEPGGVLSRPLQQATNAVFSGDDSPLRTYFIPDGKSLAALHLEDGTLIEETEKLLDWGEGKTAFLPKQVKLFADGAMYSLAMQVSQPYQEDEFHGEWIMQPDEFNATFDAYWEAGFQLHVHQTGDLAVDMILDAVERNMRRMPRPDHRTTFVHFGYAREDQAARIAELGCIVSANPYYVTALSDRYGDIGLGPERADDIVPLGPIKARGIPISLHSDVPMAPGEPLFLVWAAANRTTVSGRVAGPEHRLSVQDALRAVTIDAAQSLRLETELGSITPGKFANFTILETDPFEVEADAIKDIGIWGTVLEGEIFPVGSVEEIDKALLAPAKDVIRRESKLPEAPAHTALVAQKGMLAGCSCCASPASFACTPSVAGRTSTVGCCGTNALGWAVVAEWATRA
ncbi:amidohydrolase [Roseibium album]|uniref:N-substituted formamide deformylase n=1 Tax=Roseibium album TaxID=311410 RepID=A0A0M7ADX9_9HYPH|nr:amidohydrolase [Roseibium album]CTQ58528.1 N-substituted formamide deformylase precursor [Roseibium album]CTQ66712.1 N-substituted formamide deformylase precursor [Roseibium album]CTQ71834.1 N-substituted formamide deformylase precursor [Roseibium album]